MNTDNGFKLTKQERISRKLILDRLFVDGKSFVVYPIRVVYLVNEELQDLPLAMMVSVSKKKFKRAVKRNYLKRRIREAFRLNKNRLVRPEGVATVSLAFLYLSNDLAGFEQINRKMEDVFEVLNKKLCSESC